jgi:nitrite reductase/ring-hydroxylating ferredoxin subunit
MSESTSRRRFLQVIAASGAGLAVACVGGCAGSFGKVSAGNVKDLPVGSLRVISGQSAAVGRDERGVYAMTLICTHQQCDMTSDGSVSDSGAVCNCHGSVFDANGDPVAGPARDPLEHYQVSIAASGEITVDGDTTVDSSTRVQPPVA